MLCSRVRAVGELDEEACESRLPEIADGPRMEPDWGNRCAPQGMQELHRVKVREHGGSTRLVPICTRIGDLRGLVLWKVGLLYGPNYFCHIYLWHTVDVMDSVVMLVHFVAVRAVV